jgi:hypothetical protein
MVFSSIISTSSRGDLVGNAGAVDYKYRKMILCPGKGGGFEGVFPANRDRKEGLGGSYGFALNIFRNKDAGAARLPAARKGESQNNTDKRCFLQGFQYRSS